MILKRTFEECVSLFSYQCSSLSQTALIFYHVVLTLSRTFLSFFQEVFSFFFDSVASNFDIISQVLFDVNNFFKFFKTFLNCFHQTEKEGFEPSHGVNRLYP